MPRWFECRVGWHRVDPVYQTEKDGRLTIIEEGRNVTVGEPFQAEVDLDKMYPDKIVAVPAPGSTVVPPASETPAEPPAPQNTVKEGGSEETYSVMTLEELKRVAADMEVPVTKGMTKDQLIKALVDKEIELGS